MAVTINGVAPNSAQKQDMAQAFDMARCSLDHTTGAVVGLVGPDGNVFLSISATPPTSPTTNQLWVDIS